MKSQSLLVRVVFVSLVVMTWSQFARAYVIPAPTAAGDPEHVKRSLCNTFGGCSGNRLSESERKLDRRSLCNTFGGCGAKRSMQQLAYPADIQRFDPLNSGDNGGAGSGGKNEPWSSTVSRRESKLELISEILNDLIDYLKTSEKYKQGKYIVMVSKPVESGNEATGNLQLNALDVQELQAAHKYMNKDE